MNFKPLISILLCCLHLTIYSQSSSLLDQLHDTNNDLERIDIYIQLSQEYIFTDSEKSVEYAKKARELTQLNQVSNEIRYHSINQLGKAYLVLGEYNQSISILKNALTDNTVTDSIKLEYYGALGMGYHMIEDYTDAIFFSQHAIRLSEKLNIPERSIMARGTISAIYKKQKKYKEALKVIDEALKISLRVNDKDQSKVLAFAYKDIGYIQMKLNQMDEAFLAIQKSIDIANKNRHSYIESEARNNLSKIYLKQSNLDNAIQEALNSKKLAIESNANKLILESTSTLLDCYLETKQLKKAKVIANEMLDLAIKFDFKNEIIFANQYISKIAAKNNDHKKAYQAQLKVTELVEQSYEKEKQKHFQLTEEKINRVKEDLLIQQMKEEAKTDKINLRRSKAFGIIMVITFLFTMICSFILYHYGIIQKQIFKTSFFKNETEVKLQYIKQASFFSTILLLPLLLYSYLWENYTGAFATGISISIVIIAHLFAKAKKINYTFFTLILLYVMVAISPLTSGAIYSVLILNFGIFLGIHFLKPEPKYQLINTSFAITSTFLFYYFIRNYPSPDVPYPADLELIISAIAFFVANITLFYFSKNISDYKEELISKNNFLIQIADVNPHLIFAKDINRKYSFANKILSEKYLMSKDEFIGKLYEDFENHDKNWAAQVKEDDLNILNNGISIIGKEEKIYNFNGESMWVSTTKKPILNQDNEVVGLLGVTIDITERKLREDHLKESESRYRELFNLSFDGLFIIDIDGKILNINAAAKSLFNIRKEDSTQISDYFPNIHELIDLKKFHQSLIHFGPLSRVDGKKESNEMVPLELIIFKIPYSKETKIAFAFKDISSQLNLQKKEQELESLNKEFVSQEIFANTKNKLLSEIKNDVADIIPHINGKGKQELNKLIRKIGSNINDEENFFSFKLKFEKSHPEFFDSLNNLNPKLTNNDLKLCAYMRLGMTSMEISNLQFIEKKSVEMSKYRLKKKLQLEAEDDLNTFIQNL